ncbi:hypothetical protein A7975_24450 [Bacillus sp. FJAT-26390]|nr:hypothetical protein A7975_24450 [Bacillus sp. FJAT-26390]
MSMFKRMKKSVSFLVVLAMSLSLFSNVWAAEKPASDDLKNHWAETNMRKWIEQGLLQGYDDGSYQPNQAITRAELIALINRSFKLTEQAKISFTDLTSTNWAYAQVAAAVNAEYVKGYEDGTIRPNRQVTREEASRMVASLLKLELGGDEGTEQFKDESKIAAWSKPSVAALVNKKVISGYTNGNFGPQDKLTRAQAVTLLVNALAVYIPDTNYDKAGVYGPESGTQTLKGNVIVSSAGVTLQNTIIEGNLTIAATVGEGDAIFKKVSVKGTTSIQGGGANSIHFEDSVLVRITVDKKDGSVRVVVAGATSVQHVLVQTPVKLEESFVTDSGFKDVELSNVLPANSQVQLTGVFENVNVLASNIKVSIPSGTINKLNIDSAGSNAEVNLGKDAKVLQLVLDAVAKLIGQGKVEKAIVNNGAKGSSFETKPSEVSGDGASNTTPPSSGGAIGGGSNGGNNGGSDGGSNGGGSSNGCEGANPPIECKDASLMDVSLKGLSLTQLDTNYYEKEIGFKPDVFSYSVIVDRNIQALTVPVTVTKSTYEKVFYRVISGHGNTIENKELQTDTSTFNVNIAPLSDNTVVLSVISGDKLHIKEYTINIHYPRTIQEASMIKRQSTYKTDAQGNQSLEYTYLFELSMVEGKRLLSTDSIELYKSGELTPFKTCTSDYCMLKADSIASATGSFDVKVIRDQELLYSGTYHYDMTPVTRITENFGVRAVTLSKQELIDAFKEEPYFQTPFRNAYTIYLDPQKITQEQPNAKYIGYSYESILLKTSSYPEAPGKDNLKLNTAPFEFNFRNIGLSARAINADDGKEYSLVKFYYHQTTDPQAPKNVDDIFFYIYLYDANYKVIGYYVIPVTFDEDHVADGYTPLHTWNP